jgi:hypothetical protein
MLWKIPASPRARGGEAMAAYAASSLWNVIARRAFRDGCDLRGP